MSERVHTIVAGIAEVLEVDPHLASALELAEALGATLHLVHAFPVPDAAVSLPDDTDAARAEAAAGLAELRRELGVQLEARVRDVASRARTVYHAVPGSASAAILEVADGTGADLLLVGATRRPGLAHAVLGTTAQRVLRAAGVPVLVNRRPGLGRPRRVLLTTDLSKLSERVHARGLALLAALWPGDAPELRALFVGGDEVLLPPPLAQVAMREKAEEWLARFLARVAAGAPAVEGTVRLGLSAREILAEAQEWDADLLVLGTHGRTGANRFLIGSVAETVLRKARCDVLLIPAAAVGAAPGSGGRGG